MKINLLSCDAERPDKRAMAKCIMDISNKDTSGANLVVEILLEGDAVEIEIDGKNAASSTRALRKFDIEYEIVE